jgi:hypothetical protein
MNELRVIMRALVESSYKWCCGIFETAPQVPLSIHKETFEGNKQDLDQIAHNLVEASYIQFS